VKDKKILFFFFLRSEIHVLSSDSSVDIENVIGSAFEMAGSVIRSGNEDLVFGSIVERNKQRRDADEFGLYGSKEVESRFQFLLGIIAFEGGRNDGDKLAFGCDEEFRRNTHDVDVVISLEFALGHNDLHRSLTTSAGDGVIQDRDDSSDLPDLLNFFWEVRRISNHEFAFRDFASRFHSDDTSTFVHEAVDRFIEHVGSSVNGSQSSKCLREFSETIAGVNVGRLPAVLSERIAIELDLLDSFESGSGKILIVLIESDSVTKEGLSILVESEFLEQFRHRLFLEIEALVSLGFFLLVCLKVVGEVATTPLFEHSHETAAHDFHSGRRDAMNLLILVDVAVLDRLEFEISSDAGFEEEFHHKARGHEEFRDQIDVVVSTLTQSRRGLLSGLEFLVELVEVERSTFSTVVVVPIDMEDFLPFDAEDATDDALFQTSS